MDLNRNQFFLAGLVILFLGIQFRLIESVVFTPQFSRLLVESSSPAALAASDGMNSFLGTPQVSPMTVRPPDWLGRFRADPARDGHEEAGRVAPLAAASRGPLLREEPLSRGSLETVAKRVCGPDANRRRGLEDSLPGNAQLGVNGCERRQGPIDLRVDLLKGEAVASPARREVGDLHPLDPPSNHGECPARPDVDRLRADQFHLEHSADGYQGPFRVQRR